MISILLHPLWKFPRMKNFTYATNTVPEAPVTATLAGKGSKDKFSTSSTGIVPGEGMGRTALLETIDVISAEGVTV